MRSNAFVPISIDVPKFDITLLGDAVAIGQTGSAHLNLAQLCLMNPTFQSYAKMYDQVKIHSCSVSMMPLSTMAVKGIICTAWDRCGSLSETTSTYTGVNQPCLYQPHRNANILNQFGTYGTEPNVATRGKIFTFSELQAFSSAQSYPVTSYNTASSNRYLKGSTITEKSTFYNSPYSQPYFAAWSVNPNTVPDNGHYQYIGSYDGANFQFSEFIPGLFGITPQMGSFNPVFYVGAYLNEVGVAGSMSFYVKMLVNCVFRGSKGSGSAFNQAVGPYQAVAAPEEVLAPVAADVPPIDESSEADFAVMRADSLRTIPLRRSATSRVPSAMVNGNATREPLSLRQRFAQSTESLPYNRQLLYTPDDRPLDDDDDI